MPNQHALLGIVAPILTSMFHAEAGAGSSIPCQQESGTDVNAAIDHG